MKFRLLIFLLFPLYVFAQNTVPDTAVNDGPYIFYKGDRIIAQWIKDGQLKSDTLTTGKSLQIDPGVSATFNPAYLNVQEAFVPSRQCIFSGVTKYAAISDIHGQYEVMRKLLTAHHIIDEDGNWSFGDGHLVIVGDIFDRGDEVMDILWLVHKLEQQALKANGRVHYLLGNHEVMIMQGDLRYVNKKYRYTSAALGMPYQMIFNADSYLGRWLRSKPIAISINKTVFVHGGFSAQYLQVGLSNEELNSAFHKLIIDQPEDSILADPKLHLLYDEQGPIWYRGYFEDTFTLDQAKAILKQAGKRNIVVGHTSFSGILPLYHNRIIGIDSSIKFGKTGEILLYENKHFYRGLLNGEKEELL